MRIDDIRDELFKSLNIDTLNEKEKKYLDEKVNQILSKYLPLVKVHNEIFKDEKELNNFKNKILEILGE